jgi:D-alanyl-D-alanine carboxypeptidase (penicillin-binding protein 5/6)
LIKPLVHAVRSARLAPVRLARRLTLGGASVVLACLVLANASAGAAAPSRTERVAPPVLQAREAILVETDTGTTVFARRAQAEVPIASTTKMMTAYVTLEHEQLDHVFVEQPYSPAPGESLAGLTPGAHYSVADLLRAMLLPSGGDAAHTLAVDVGGGSLRHFLKLMNAAAKQLMMGDTHYTTPVGLDTPGNYSTATDLARLAQALLRFPFVAKIVSEPRAQLHSGLVVTNRNDLVGEYPFVVGVKTGHTDDAGYCLVGAASWHGVHLVSVVLGDGSIAQRDADTLALLRYGLRLYHDVPVAVGGRSYADVAVDGSSGQHVALVASRSAKLVASRATKVTVAVTGVPSQLQGPLAEGTTVGSLAASEDGRVVLSVPLVTATAIAAIGPTSSASSYGVAILVLIVLGGCTLRLMRWRATRHARRRGKVNR